MNRSQTVQHLVRLIAATVVVGAGLALGEEAVELEALSLPRWDLKLGFSVAGKVAKVLVERGQAVQEGQVLIELDDREIALAEEIARLRAESELEVQRWEQELALAELDERRLKELLEKHAAAPVEYERAQINAAIARLKLAAARQQREDLDLQRRQVEARRSQYRLTAPRAGLVEQLTVQAGESVEADKPVLRLVVIDPLLVEVWVKLETARKLNVGQSAWVKLEAGSEREWVEGRIVFIAATADVASGTRLVQVEVANPQRIPAGTPVRVRFSASGTE